ncbi:hypothetical protein KRMM14A1004_23220 [Krasilnikovia sp. MM14-A1004]
MGPPATHRHRPAALVPPARPADGTGRAMTLRAATSALTILRAATADMTSLPGLTRTRGAEGPY